MSNMFLPISPLYYSLNPFYTRKSIWWTLSENLFKECVTRNEKIKQMLLQEKQQVLQRRSHNIEWIMYSFDMSEKTLE